MERELPLSCDKENRITGFMAGKGRQAVRILDT